MSVLYTTNILTTNYALLYISFPVQVIDRNIRFLLVVIVGAFFSRVSTARTDLRVGKYKLVNALFITAGVLLFNFAKPQQKRGDELDPSKEWIGYALLVVSVLSDALFSDSQAYAKAAFGPNATQLFTTINLGALVFTTLVAGLQGTILQSLAFVRDYPGCMVHVGLSGLLQIVGQVCIYQVIANFKQHVFPLISTTRKVITVLLSIFIFGHDVASLQWVALAVVFAGMVYELAEELRKPPKKQTLLPQ